jgi:glycosyltransferase involved in cell wall biosynthesis
MDCGKPLNILGPSFLDMSKRVLIFSPDYHPLMSGAEIAVKEITDRLPDWKFDLVCARRMSGLPSSERYGNVTIHRVGIGSGDWNKYLLPFLGPLRALFLGSVNALPIAWSLMASYGGFATLVYAWLRPKTKMLLTLQEGDPLEHYAKRVGMLEFLHRGIFKRADAVQAISHFLAGWAKRMGFKGEPEVIPNGVDVATFSARMGEEERRALREKMGYGPGDVVLITTSRLTLKNGVDDLIRSLLFLPDQVKALIVGDGEDAEKLRVLTEQKGLTARVSFLGKKPHEALPELLQSSDIFVRPALSEGLGISYLEAMAAGLPIIGTPVGGIPDFLRDGETGVFCEPRDPESVARAVTRLVSDAPLRERVSVQGRALVERDYTWDGIAKRMDNLFRRLVVLS